MSATQQRLVLFDIDGTLLTPGPFPRQALNEVLSGFLARPFELTYFDVAGFTDPVIVQNALKKAGYNGAADAATIRDIIDSYLVLLAERLPGSGTVQVFPGALELVQACRSAGWTTVVMTGNVERGARLKLAGTGIWELLDFGVFGDDGETRDDLPGVAMRRAGERLQRPFAPAHTILIGDTPNDAHAAGVHGIASMIVCRRDAEWRQAIQAESPDWIIDTLENTGDLMDLIRNLAP